MSLSRRIKDIEVLQAEAASRILETSGNREALKVQVMNIPFVDRILDSPWKKAVFQN